MSFQILTNSKSITSILQCPVTQQVTLSALLCSTASQWEPLKTKTSNTVPQVVSLATLGFPFPLPPAVIADMQTMYTLYIPDEDWLECLPRTAVDCTLPEVAFTPILQEVLTLTNRILKVKCIKLQLLILNRKMLCCQVN